MARPSKIDKGIDYFPFDVDTDQDEKMYYIEAKHGIQGLP